MPVELLDRPPEVSVTTAPKTTQELGRPKVNLRHFLPDRIRDEFNNTNVTVLKPRPIIIEDKPDLADQFSKQLDRDFQYYSRTRDLETGTKRTEIIQGVVDRLTQGSNIETRVVIMNKGRAPQAQVTADGTIFISQSLINRLDSVDEIAAVLAHEVGHLINRTSIVLAQNPAGQFGLGFAHEAGCDAIAPQLLEKAGFKSWAFSTAIEKISGYDRGTIHQSGLARASQSVGSHLAIDRETSGQQEIPIPQSIRGRFSRTNLEIVMDKLDERLSLREFYETPVQAAIGLKKALVEKLTPIKPLLEQLHPRDLGEVYKRLINNRDYYSRAEMQECEAILSTRLKTAGFNQAQIKLFLVSNLPQYGANFPEDAYMFKKPQDLQDVVSILEEFESKQELETMYHHLFDSGKGSQPTTPTDRLLHLMSRTIYDVDFENTKPGLPVTRETLLNSLETISQSGGSRYSDYILNAKMRLTGQILSAYIQRTYLTLVTQAGEELDGNQIKDFFQEIKDRGIAIIPTDLLRNLEDINMGIEYTKWASDENKQRLIDAFKQVFEIETPSLTTEKIDQFFAEFVKEELDDRAKAELLGNFLEYSQEYLNTNDISDEQRLFFAKYLGQKLEVVTLHHRDNLIGALNEGFSEARRAGNESQLVNDAIRKFNLLTIIGVTFFKRDSEQFYSFLDEASQKMNPYLNNLSRIGLINLCQGLFSLDQRFTPRSWIGQESRQDLRLRDFRLLGVLAVVDHERFFKIPSIKRIIDGEENITFQNIAELNNYMSSIVYQLDTLIPRYQRKYSIFSDTLLSLVIGKKVREAFEGFVKQGITEQDYGELYSLLDNYYPDSTQKEQFLREINKLYLRSPNVVFDQKVEYVLAYFNQVGPEGMLILADQIQDIETYHYFRERLGARLTAYLEGKELVTVTKIAAADLLGSELVKKFETLLETCQDNIEVRKQSSTNVAGRWFQGALTELGGPGGEFVRYDANLKKFILSEQGRNTFKTLADSFSALKNLTDLQKFALIHKSLTDTDGALTTVQNRQKLADLLTKSLGLERGFVASVLRAACTEADAKLLGFPVSMMLVPLLFRTLDVGAVDLNQLGQTHIYRESDSGNLDKVLSREAILDIIKADTRSISVFGARYQNQPNSQAALLASESNQQFVSITNRLNQLLNEIESEMLKRQEVREGTKIDPAIEAVIRSIEASGALGIKSLQISTQYHSFPPALERRLSDTLDANPGLNKLLFWENLYKLAEGNEEIKQYLARITLGGYLGGGSLQTTYAAILDAGTSSERQVIVKMKNPNVETFIKESYTSAHKTLEVVSKQRRAGISAQYARTGMVLLDLSQQWCLADINDKTFLYDDEAFRQTIANFNQKEGTDIFYAPVKLFTSSKLKSETLAPGETANQFLNDQSIGFEQKQTIIRALGRFFSYQLKGEPFVDAEGKRYHLVHSDPHVGNYMVDVTGPTPRIGVIDRSMYLKLTEEDVKVLEKLIIPGNDNDFVYSFIDRVLDINKVRGVQRAATTARVMASVYLEYSRQRVRGNINKLDLMRTMLTGLSDAKVDVPLKLRLMIKNIGAFQELGKRYGIDFESLYK